jgi:uncharacterized protein (DUF924 family)
LAGTGTERKEIVMDSLEDLLTYWFPEDDVFDADQETFGRQMRWWFQGGPEIDTEITERFGGVLEQARRGELDSWAETPRGRLALIVVLDQFSRNVYRGSSLSYAQDEKALELAVEGIDTGMDRELGPMEQIFFWMPPRSLGGSSPPGSGRPPPRGESGEGPTPAEGDGRVRDLSGQGSTRRHSPLRASPAPQRLGRTSTPGELEYLRTETPPHMRRPPS